MKKWMILACLTSLAWARPGMSASEARALSQQNLTYRQACRPPSDHVFDQWMVRPEQFKTSEIASLGGLWSTERKSGQALFALPAGVCGRVVEIQLDATFIQGEMRFYTADANGQPLEEILTYHVPSREQGCEHALTHRLRVTSGQTLLVSLPAHSQMRLRRLVVQALN